MFSVDYLPEPSLQISSYSFKNSISSKNMILARILREHFNRNHQYFNRPLSQVKSLYIQATIISRIQTRLFYALNGGPAPNWRPLKQVVIRRADIIKVYEYARKHCRLRDYAMIRLAMRLGLRTGELSSLQVEDLDFEGCTIKVLDSKKRRKFTLPCDPLTMEVLRQLCEGRKKGPVFLRGSRGRKSNRRNLSENEIWSLMRRIAAKAGVEDFKPRYFRYYFAAEWVKAGKSLEMLRRILRHENIENTIRYVRRLVFFEDLQAEYLDFTRLPFIKTGNGLCSRCAYADICKYAGRLPKFAKCERFVERKTNGNRS